jgi:hypothetical protein
VLADDKDNEEEKTSIAQQTRLNKPGKSHLCPSEQEYVKVISNKGGNFCQGPALCMRLDDPSNPPILHAEQDNRGR